MEQGSLSAREQTAAGKPDLLVTGLVVLVGIAVLVFFLAETQWYNVYKAIHVLAAVIWVGGGTLLTVAALLADRARDNARLMQLGRIAAFFAERVFTPAALIVLAFGFALVQKGPWDYGDFFVVFALIAWGVSAGIGIFVLSPRVKKLNALVAQLGPEHPDVIAHLRSILVVARADEILLLLVVVDMTAKPFLY